MSRRTPIAVAIVEHAGRFLIGPRPGGVPLAGLWEFPGGKVRADESPATAAARECLEETGLAIHVGAPYKIVPHDYEHDRVELHFFACAPLDPTQAPQPPFRWIERGELRRYEFPPANAALVSQLAAEPRDS